MYTDGIYSRMVVRFSNLEELIEVYCLFFFLSSFLNPQSPGGTKVFSVPTPSTALDGETKGFETSVKNRNNIRFMY